MDPYYQAPCDKIFLDLMARGSHETIYLEL